MSHPLAAALSQNPLVRAALVTTALFVFLGAATGALPVQCLATGVAACTAPPVQKAAIVPLPAAKAPIAVAEVEPASLPPSAPTLTDNTVVSSTFALLNAGPQAVQPPAPLASVPADAAAPSSMEDGLHTRVVQTTAIHVSDIAATPATPAAPPASSASAPLAPVAPLSAPPAGSSLLTASVSDADITPAAKPKPAVVAPPKPHIAGVTITGQGANVRSSPTMGAGVLFALAGGTRVVVLGNQRGWLQVKDPRGRTGWVYSDFVSHA